MNPFAIGPRTRHAFLADGYGYCYVCNEPYSAPQHRSIGAALLASLGWPFVAVVGMGLGLVVGGIIALAATGAWAR